MGRDDDVPSGEDRDDVVRFGPPREPRRWRRWLLVAVPVLVAVISATVVEYGGRPSASPASATPPPGPSSPAGSSAASPTPSLTASPPVVVNEVGHRLLGVTAGWELFGRGPGEVVRIQLARGRITRTAVPSLRSTGPVFFLAGSDRAIVRPLDLVPGYAVPDGRRARRLRGALGHGGPVLPGPDPGHVWVETGDAKHPRMLLVDLTGGRIGVSIPVPGRLPGWPTSDGDGYLLFTGVGGVYDARPGGPHRVTTGRVVAVGPTGWLAVECDGRYHCANVVIERAGGTRRVLPGPAADTSAPVGVISPDGSTAAVFRVGSSGRTTLHLLDLASGADHPLAVPMPQGPSFDTGALAWSPDSRWLFVADGKLLAVDATTRRVRHLAVTLPPISQVAIRGARGDQPG